MKINESVRIHFTDTGSGPPLVFIHGWSLSGLVWKFQIQSLANHFRCISIDLRGHGGSTAPATECSMDEMSSDLVALFENLDLWNATLIGWSMGTLVALAAYPELQRRLASLILVSGTPKFTSSDGYPHGLPVREPRGLSLRLKRGFETTLDAFFRAMFTPEEMEGDRFRRIDWEIASCLERPSQAVALRSLDALVEADLRRNLTAIAIPVLIIHGTDDSICLPGASEYMHNGIPDSVLTFMEGAGHAPMMTRPHEFGAIVSGFLERIYEFD